MVFSKFLSVLLFFSCLFPYISLIDTPFDTQPYAILVAFTIIVIYMVFKKDINIPKLLIPFVFIVGYSIIIFIVNYQDIGSAIRSLVGYASIFLISLAGYLTYSNIKGSYFIFAVRVWFLFGLLQMVIGKGFGSFLVPRLSTSLERGITSLAVEPSYYSIICIFFLILNDVFYSNEQYSRKTYRNIVILITVQLIFSMSTLGFMIALVYLFAKMLSQMNFMKFFKWFGGMLGLIFMIVFLFTNVQSLSTTRVGKLMNIFITNPTSFLMKDGSVSDRFSHVVLSMLSLPYSYGIGFGFGTWEQSAPEISAQIGGFTNQVSTYYMSFGRIMSGWGSAVFELGLFGILLIVSFIVIMHKGIKRTNGKMKKVYISSFITILFTMLMAVPLAFPLFGYTIGIFTNIQLSKRNKSYEETSSKSKDLIIV